MEVETWTQIDDIHGRQDDRILMGLNECFFLYRLLETVSAHRRGAVVMEQTLGGVNYLQSNKGSWVLRTQEEVLHERRNRSVFFSQSWR